MNSLSTHAVPTPSAPSLSRPSGYSRRGNRFPRLCYKTVLAGFLAHGSSVIRPLSWAPCWACDLHFHASPSRVIHTSLWGVLTASAALLIPITYIPPSPRQHIRELSSRPWLLGESLPASYPVDTCSLAQRAPVRTTRGYSVPNLRLSLKGGLHSSPGFSGVYLGRLQSRPALILAFWPKPIIRVGLSHLTTIQTWIRRPVRIQLGSTGFSVGFCVTVFYPRFAD
jgi:hypothetical protein